MTKHSVELGNKLLKELHDRSRGAGSVVTYPPKAGKEEEAKKQWRHTGVCLMCHRRAISVSRCRHCGHFHIETEPRRNRGELVVAAALLLGDGIIISKPPPARHHDLIRAVTEEGWVTRVNGDQQGFITTKGRWLNRRVAGRCAYAEGQTVDFHSTLLSEHLW